MIELKKCPLGVKQQLLTQYEEGLCIAGVVLYFRIMKFCTCLKIFRARMAQ
jgi:hypothetical protein